MLKTIDHIFHFTDSVQTIKEIIRTGFKPSYARETLAKRNILVPMISFSNILVRDVGEDEVLDYGEYAVCMSRQWALNNELNPVVYTYENGLIYNALNTLLENSVFISYLKSIGAKLKDYSAHNKDRIPISRVVSLSNTSKEAIAIFDYLSLDFDEGLLGIVSDYARVVHETNLPVIALTKPYKVKDRAGEEFIAYNDREWRKSYKNLGFIFEEDPEYKKWDETKKPHFNDDPYLLKFAPADIKAILVKEDSEIKEIISELRAVFGVKIDDLVSDEQLMIGTKEMLEKENL
jgi:hypothetical protein